MRWQEKFLGYLTWLRLRPLSYATAVIAEPGGLRSKIAYERSEPGLKREFPESRKAFAIATTDRTLSVRSDTSYYI